MKEILKKITNWEQWPFKILYAPLAIFWLGYIIRSGAVWFFTPSNPKITFGGLSGEPKKEMYDLLPKELYPSTFNVLPGENFENIQSGLLVNKITFPLIVKPEIGEQGMLFRKLDTEQELMAYHAKVPVEYIIQEMIVYPLEVSIFYIRYPYQEKGKITGFLHKIPLQVIGDGQHTLYELILKHPKASNRQDEMKSKHAHNFEKVLATGEKYMLNYAANHNRGAHFINLVQQIDPKLVSVFDRISHSVNDFFYGRYDVMCNSIEELKDGKNFSILEYNGCGAEPNHFYDTGYTLMGAYRVILSHWKALYEISRYNSKQGIRPWPFWKGMRFLRNTNKLFKMMRVADQQMT